MRCAVPGWGRVSCRGGAAAAAPAAPSRPAPPDAARRRDALLLLVLSSAAAAALPFAAGATPSSAVAAAALPPPIALSALPLADAAAAAPLARFSDVLQLVDGGHVLEAWFAATAGSDQGGLVALRLDAPVSLPSASEAAAAPATGLLALPFLPSRPEPVPPPASPPAGPSSVFRSALPPGGAAALLSLLTARGVPFSAQPPRPPPPDSSFGEDFGFAVRLSAFAAVAFALLSADGGLSTLLRRPARLFDPAAAAASRPGGGQPAVTFADVAGCDEAKASLAELSFGLRQPQALADLGAVAPRGVLLAGPPGTGKTLLARALATEAGVPFLSASGSEFVELFVGLGARRVRALFADARKRAPCVLFIDEIDAVGGARSSNAGGGSGVAGVANEEREQTLNQLLSEMDGFEGAGAAPVVVLAATNRPESLDAALKRPGRFDRTVSVAAPDAAGREAILRVHARRLPRVEAAGPGCDAADPLRLAAVAAATPGLTGARLAALVNEAALAAARAGDAAVGAHHLAAAADAALAGAPRPSLVLQPLERARVCVHEAGHAAAAHVLAPLTGAPLLRVSRVPRASGALGLTLAVPSADAYLATAPALRARLVVLLAGREAERLVLGGASSGASDDLRAATATAHDMAARFGMTDEVGPRALGGGGGGGGGGAGGPPHPDDRPASALLSARADDAVDRLLRGAAAAAAALVGANRAAVAALAAALDDAGTLDGARLAALVATVDAPPEVAAWLAGGDGAPQQQQPAAPPVAAAAAAGQPHARGLIADALARGRAAGGGGGGAGA